MDEMTIDDVRSYAMSDPGNDELKILREKKPIH